MGYRSQVKSVIYGSSENIAKLKATQEYLNVLDQFDSEYLSEHSINDNTQAILFSGGHLKWYDEYADVKAWHKLIELSPSVGLSAEFLRVGEEAGDIENHNYGDECNWYLYVTTSIEADFI